MLIKVFFHLFVFFFAFLFFFNGINRFIIEFSCYSSSIEYSTLLMIFRHLFIFPFSKKRFVSSSVIYPFANYFGPIPIEIPFDQNLSPDNVAIGQSTKVK